MPRITVGRFPRLAALIFAAVLGLGIVAGASADAPPGRGPSGGPAPTPTPSPAPIGEDCAVLRVQLNGDRPATHTCLAPAPSAPGTGSPEVAGIDTTYPLCVGNYLQLYQDTQYGGKRICFTGVGTTSLVSYRLSPESWWDYRTWDDRVSSFRTGEQYVNFYEHISAGGAKLRYAPYQQRAYMPSGWNDRISSLCIPAPIWPCP